MRITKLSVLALATAWAAAPAHAALWSSTNAVAPVGGTTTMSISLTGDQRTIGAELDVGIPTGIRVLSVIPRNGGVCALQPGGRTVRILVLDWNLLPLPAIAQSYCDITLRVTGYATPWFSMFNDLCIDALGGSSRCMLDKGHITITAP